MHSVHWKSPSQHLVLMVSEKPLLLREDRLVPLTAPSGLATLTRRRCRSLVRHLRRVCRRDHLHRLRRRWRLILEQRIRQATTKGSTPTPLGRGSRGTGRGGVPSKREGSAARGDSAGSVIRLVPENEVSCHRKIGAISVATHCGSLTTKAWESWPRLPSNTADDL